MKTPSPISRFRRSLPDRLSLWIVVFAAAIFVGALGYLFWVAQKAVRREAIQGATRVLDNTILRVNNILEDVELAADNLEWLIYEDLHNPDIMMEHSRNVVLNNTFLNGCSISFEPYYYKSKGRYYSAYSNNNGKAVYTQQKGSDEYQYFYKEWYLLPKLMMQPCWTEPYTDQEEGDADTMDSRMMVSYCKPLIDNDNEFIGVFTMDVSLEWLSNTISSVKPYPNSYSVLLGRGGTFMVHPNPDKLFYQSVFTETLSDPESPVYRLGSDMVNWKEGMQLIDLNGVPSYVFYKPLTTTGWSVGIVCPEKDIFGAFHRLQNIIIIIVMLGLVLMYVVFSHVIGRLLSPLHDLAVQAQTIAAGHFDSKLPPATRSDEVGALSRSFDEMQTSLVKYIDELTATTAKKERIEGELQIARDIQLGMVPRVFPPFPGRRDIDLYASITPAREVGGDLYYYFIEKEVLYFCIGDVSGKGAPSSIFMAEACALFRQVAKLGLPPAGIARQINDTLSENNAQLMFITMFIGRLDLRTGSLEFCNCGHNPPVLMSPAPHFLDCLPNTPVGIGAGFPFQGQVLEGGIRGKALVLYTDGLNEAENRFHEEFGNERMLEVLSGQPSADARTLIEALLDAVAAHVNGAEASDDLTLLCLKLA